MKYANVTKGYHNQYWEIGNEVYGNGCYGADWELDEHASKSPATYAANVVQYVQAMKAVDPTVKIGVVLTLPDSWPDGVVASGDSKDWNQTVLPIVGPRSTSRSCTATRTTQGRLSGIALELVAAVGNRLPVLVTSVVKMGRAGQTPLIRTTILDARDRRAKTVRRAALCGGFGHSVTSTSPCSGPRSVR